jgi:formate dehydrogenase iron-sulfur subunit
MIQNPAILTDVTKCIGCEECVSACKKINGLPETDASPRPGSTPDGLSADRWTAVVRRPGNHFVRKRCRHCEEPACVSVCPVGALQKTPEGPVIYDKSICMGCRYCMLGCPFGIPHYEWTSPAPSVRKCILCYPSLKSGKVQAPACVTACPKEATIFGSREEMLREAWRRVKSDPSKYVQQVWGEKEVGGTSVLYIADISLDFLALGDSRQLTDKPLPQNTWAALKPVPFEFVGMGALMGAIYWIIERRRALAGGGSESADAEREEGGHGK